MCYYCWNIALREQAIICECGFIVSGVWRESLNESDKMLPRLLPNGMPGIVYCCALATFQIYKMALTLLSTLQYFLMAQQIYLLLLLPLRRILET